MSTLPPAAQRVQASLREHALDAVVRALPASTRSAQDAAAALECTVGEIAKSLVFRTVASARPVLVIASGVNLVALDKLAQLCGEAVMRADAAFVRTHTGFAIGGIPPLAHTTSIASWFDRDLLAFERVWAAAGTPHAVFAIAPRELLCVTGACLADIKQS
jgi:prolyl-tRNA editing enzyme YbaK/EbsC (Cys-tRNA(Pro) deacylase)